MFERCPASTGIPAEPKRCRIHTNTAHACKRRADVHFEHVCLCGTKWWGSTPWPDHGDDTRANPETRAGL